MTAERRWPDAETVVSKAREGILVDTIGAVDIYDLEDWEILGDPTPDEPADSATEPGRRTA
jgi:hypothetical protein